MIPVSCDPEGKLDRVPLDQIEEFQGNLKSLGKTEYAKLKQSITEKGFVVPCFAWRNGSDKWKLLDGHQRVRVIRNEGWEIDGGIPIVEIAAEDERDAKEKLLAIVSRYGRVEGQGLYEFLDGTGIDLEQWAVPDLPDLDLDSWLDEFVRDIVKESTDLSDSIDFSFRVEVTVENEQEQELLYNRLKGEGLECRLLTL